MVALVALVAMVAGSLSRLRAWWGPLQGAGHSRAGQEGVRSRCQESPAA